MQLISIHQIPALIVPNTSAAAAAAKSLQSCPTLCDPIDGSPPGSTVPGILQARNSFKNVSIIIQTDLGSDINSALYQVLIGEGNGTPLQYSCLENPMDGGAW